MSDRRIDMRPYAYTSQDDLGSRNKKPHSGQSSSRRSASSSSRSSNAVNARLLATQMETCNGWLSHNLQVVARMETTINRNVHWSMCLLMVTILLAVVILALLVVTLVEVKNLDARAWRG